MKSVKKNTHLSVCQVLMSKYNNLPMSDSGVVGGAGVVNGLKFPDVLAVVVLLNTWLLPLDDSFLL